MAAKTTRDVLLRGLRVLGIAIREQPRLFAAAVAGSVVFSLLVVTTAYVVGAVVGEVAIPAIDSGRAEAGVLVLAAGALVGLSVLRVLSMFARRLGAGYMQYRLQASHRPPVTPR